MTLPKRIHFVTSNINKLAEVQQILQSSQKQSFELVQANIDLPELQGDPYEVARQKCIFACKQMNGPVLVEDTSLCFQALGELPGVYVKWFLEKIKVQGLINLLAAYENKIAFAQCIFSFSLGPGKPVHVFIGRTQGIIVDTPRGPMDSFGWDSVFQPDEYKTTFAEMTKDEKNLISHRYKALKQVCEFFNT